MGKYDALRYHLETIPHNVSGLTLTFAKIESILGATLPPSARQHRAWWANPSSPTDHPYAQAWLNIGWVVESVDQQQEWVHFQRKVE